MLLENNCRSRSAGFLQKPADLNLHYFQKDIPISGLAGHGLIVCY